MIDSLFTGQHSDQEISDYLAELADRGETVEEIVQLARAMRERMIPVHLGCDAIDVCGTGGSGKDRFNVSTAAAFILASLGVPVAKHGNRGSKKANGSFDFLEALGVPFELSILEIEAQFKRTNRCFLFARQHHPAVGKVAAARKLVGRRTIFNLVGPLCNPASVSYQLIGCIDLRAAELMANAAQQLGTKRTWVVVGGDGLDELAVGTTSTVFDVTPSGIETREIQTTSVDGPVRDFSNVIVNAALFKEILTGQHLDEPVVAHIVLNVAAALVIVGRVASIDEGQVMALQALKMGAVTQTK